MRVQACLETSQSRLCGQSLEPGRSTILAMNHTDRYNYWPFQFQLWRQGRGFTATWVKGKYYENPFIAAFMDANNNIPLPSRGYVITTRFREADMRLYTHVTSVISEHVNGIKMTFLADENTKYYAGYLVRVAARVRVGGLALLASSPPANPSSAPPASPTPCSRSSCRASACSRRC